MTVLQLEKLEKADQRQDGCDSLVFGARPTWQTGVKGHTARFWQPYITLAQPYALGRSKELQDHAHALHGNSATDACLQEGDAYYASMGPIQS